MSVFRLLPRSYSVKQRGRIANKYGTRNEATNGVLRLRGLRDEGWPTLSGVQRFRHAVQVVRASLLGWQIHGRVAGKASRPDMQKLAKSECRIGIRMDQTGLALPTIQSAEFGERQRGMAFGVSGHEPPPDEPLDLTEARLNHHQFREKRSRTRNPTPTVTTSLHLHRLPPSNHRPARSEVLPARRPIPQTTYRAFVFCRANS